MNRYLLNNHWGTELGILNPGASTYSDLEDRGGPPESMLAGASEWALVTAPEAETARGF